MKILNIHGYRGSSDNSAYHALLPLGVEIISPQMDYDKQSPDEILLFLNNLWQQHNCQAIVGTSLGGFYAALLSMKHHAKTVLINPCLLPFLLLPQLEESQNTLLFDYLRLFADMVKIDKNQIVAIIGEQDEVISTHDFTQNLLGKSRCICVPNGKHSGWTLPLEQIFQQHKEWLFQAA